MICGVAAFIYLKNDVYAGVLYTFADMVITRSMQLFINICAE